MAGVIIVSEILVGSVEVTAKQFGFENYLSALLLLEL